MHRILGIFLAGLFLCLGPVTAPAQNPLAEPVQETPSVPEPASLRPGWWGYLADAPPEELQDRATQLKEAVDRVVLALNVEDSPQAVELADRAKREIDGYVSARAASVSEPPLNLRESGEFSLTEYLELRRRYWSLGEDIQRETVELEELADLRGLERRKVDEALNAYQRIGDSVQKVITGLRLIADRALLAVTELRLERKQSRLEYLESQRDAYQSQAEYAVRNLDPSAFDLEAATTRLAERQAALEDAQEATRSARDALLDLDPQAEYATIRTNYIRQRRLAATLEENQRALELGQTRAAIAWYRLNRSEEDVQTDEAHALVAELQGLLTRIDENMDGWQRSGEQLLLAQDTTQIRDREVRLMRDRSRELGQENLLNLRELHQMRGVTSDVVNVLTTAIANSEGGVSGAWRRLQLAVIDAWHWLSDLTDSPLFYWGDIPITPLAILKMVLVVAGALLMSFLLRRGLDRLGQRRHLHDRSSLYLLGRVAHYLMIIVGIFLALSILGFDFTSVALVAGALSVGIGFGLQSIVNNFVSGLILMFDRSLKIGDYIELDSGLTGVVKEIKVRSTRINTNDNVDVLVPNSEFFNSRLINWTHADGLGRFRISFGVAYGSEKEKVREAALKAAEDVDYTLHNMPGKEPEVWLVNFGDSSLDFILLVWVSRQGVRRPTRVRSAYLWAIETRLREYGIEIPFPQRDLHLRTGFLAPGESAVPESD
ncbi:MAG: mechanosensitive ion channel [Xanthomonadales bacterium]|nr:mechanosensitive ion channel [Xanthomonadales bacterium]